MRRRDFITLIGAAAWPLAARAQQPPPMPVIGLIHLGALEIDAYRVAPFRQGLKEAGYVEGQNVAIEYRWARGRGDLMPELVADLLRRRVTLIATPGSLVGTLAAKAATTTVPIVFSSPEDPPKLGLVASLARPGGNLTGVNFFNTEVTANATGQPGIALRDPGSIRGPLTARGRRVDELRKRPCGHVSAGRRLCRANPQGRQACRAPDRAIDKDRAGHQRRDRPNARPLAIPPSLLAIADALLQSITLQLALTAEWPSMDSTAAIAGAADVRGPAVGGQYSRI
jgi:hypothetical protein